MKTIKAEDHFLYFPESDFRFFDTLIKTKEYSSYFLLVDENTEKHCLSSFLSRYALPQNLEVICIEAGEENKHLATCEGVWEALSELGADRHSLLINLGGGVVTDLGGFVASTFKRGIDFINIPTTLLAMVDASVGGKTGVDLGVLKNQIGVINNPQAVIIDPSFLTTLPANEYRSGYAEMLKHGLIQDPAYWEKLANFQQIHTHELGTYISHSVTIKQQVVDQDPFEHSLRKILNFGHTLGHAIESYFLANEKKTTLLHGEAIAIGMILEAYLSRELLGLGQEDCHHIKKVFNAIYPLVDISKEDEQAILDLLIFDKKNKQGKVRFVLLKQIGEPVWDIEVPQETLKQSFAFYNNP